MSSMLKRGAAAVLVVMAAGTGCATPSDDDGPGHQIPAGVSVRQGTFEVARARRIDHIVQVTGGISVVQGTTSPELTLVFLDSAAVPLILNDNPYYPFMNPANDDVATWTPAEPGSFMGTVTGHQVGQTTIGITLFVGELNEGEPAGLGFNIPVTVTAPPQ